MKHKMIYPIVITIFLALSINVHGQEGIPKTPEPPLEPTLFYGHDISKEDETKILAKLPEDVKADLLKVKELDEEEYRNLLFSASHLGYEYYLYDTKFEKEMVETSKRINELDLQTEILGIQYFHADAQERTKIKKELQSKLEMLFDLKEKERRSEVEMLERELAELKASLEVRKRNKADIILRRLSELIGKDDYLDW
ncbi:MAG: hypothetical protein DRI33_05030 [Caldiserica bacterium]|nr:MAG: hypothetical protein DRI33_05030 [Caldisericota bacterium]